MCSMTNLRQFFKRPFLYLPLAIIGLLVVADLGISSVPSGSEDFATIPDVSVDALSSRVAPRQVATGVTRGIQYLGDNKVYSDGGSQQIVVEDTSNPRTLMGNHATFGEGFFVSKTGYNAKTETNPANYSFNSNQNHVKIIASGDVTVTRSAGTTTGSATVSYASYGFAQSLSPGLLAFSSGIPLPVVSVDTSGTSAGLINGIISCSVNYFLQQFTFTITAPDYAANSSRAFSQNAIIHYYLTQETAN